MKQKSTSDSLYKAEKDSIFFLGLMSHMSKYFDKPITGPTGETTHKFGLNIHAALTDNTSGAVLGLNKNSIHQYNNPLLHAEQLALKEAIESRNKNFPRNPKTTTVEEYYRNFLFNNPFSYDALNEGATIYTTLEPCPFCTSALLVSRVKRIVFILPDSSFGNSFYSLWSTYYKKYDVRYEQLKIETGYSSISDKASSFLKRITNKKANPNLPATLFFDTMKAELTQVFRYFKTIRSKNIKTKGSKKKMLLQSLSDFNSRL